MRIGTPLSPSATRVMLLGSGELGKEVAIELQRLGVEVIAVDRYADAPGMQVAHRSHVVTMTDGAALRAGEQFSNVSSVGLSGGGNGFPGFGQHLLHVLQSDAKWPR